MGYTNAGKSSLFNQLTNATVYAADQLFATLDPTLKKVALTDAVQCICADTVGFIRHLPHDLVVSFKATLQETQDADLLLHVIDCADPDMYDNMETVQQVLQQLEADQVPQLIVFNKLDFVQDVVPKIEYDAAGLPIKVWISAHQPEHMHLVKQAIIEKLAMRMLTLRLIIPLECGQYQGLLFKQSDVLHHDFDDQGQCVMHVRLPEVRWQQLIKETNGELEQFIVISDTIN